MTKHDPQDRRKSKLEASAHLIILGIGLLNIAVLPLGHIPLPPGVTSSIGGSLFAAGLILNLLAFMTLGEGAGGRVEPVGKLATRSVYAIERHPMYAGFALTILGLDVLMGSFAGILLTLALFLPSLVWRAKLEEAALADRFGAAWSDYATRVPSVLLLDCRRRPPP